VTINYLDIVLAVLLLLFAWSGFRKGLVIELATLVALILGIYLAYYFSGLLTEKLKEFFTISDQYLEIISFIVIFIAVLLLVLLVGKLFEKIIDVLLLGFLNKLAGAIFSILKGALFISIFIFIVEFVSAGNHFFKKETRESSVLYPPIASIVPSLVSWVDPEKFNFDFHKEENKDEKIF
jgi:membrane protein required for colicin V production